MENPDLKKPNTPQHPKTHTLADSFRFALTGVAHTLKTQRNMKLHVLAALAILLLGLIFPFGSTSKAIILLCIGLVIFAETMNTAMEAIVDLYTGETHRLAQIAKDAAAGGVMVLSLCSIFIFFSVLESHQYRILTMPLLLEKLALVAGIVALEGLSLFAKPGSLWPFLAQALALIGMILMAIVANEPIFSSAAFLLMALISFSPLILKKDENN